MRHDHPAALLRKRAVEHREQDGPTTDFPDVHARGFNAGLIGAAEFLSGYETQKGITFEALDTEALRNVKADYEAVRANCSSPQMPEQVRNLIDSLGDLLGLD